MPISPVLRAALGDERAPTPSRRRGLEFLGQATKNHWSARKYATEARISPDLAKILLAEHSANLRQIQTKAKESQLNELVRVARKVQNAEIVMSEKMLALNERLFLQITSGQDLSSREIKDLIAIRAGNQKIMESATGLDVAKAVAVRKATDTKGAMLAWDGVEALEMEPLALLEGGDTTVREDEPVADVMDGLDDEPQEADFLADLW